MKTLEENTFGMDKADRDLKQFKDEKKAIDEFGYIDANYNVKVSNSFASLSILPAEKPETCPVTTSSLNLTTNILPLAKIRRRSPSRAPSSPSSRSTVPTNPGTPPEQNLQELAKSFQNFLQVFKDEEKELKYVKHARKMREIQSSGMFISILDIEKHNSFLAERIKANQRSLIPALKAEARTFVTDFLGIPLGSIFLFTITMDRRK